MLEKRTSAAALLFNGHRLTMARQLAGLKKAHLARMLQMSPASVTAWENGSKKPSSATIAKISLALGVAPQFFSSGMPIQVDQPHFRSLRATPQIDQDRAKAYGEFIAEVTRLFETVVDFPPVMLPSNLTVYPDESGYTPEQAARKTREFFQIPPGPIQHVIRFIERAGVVVVFSQSDTAAIDAYSMHSAGRPLVILNPAKDDYYRQRFDAAHELGHLIMHVDAEPGGKIAEQQAHRFAAEFLMPANDIKPFLPKTTSHNGWSKLADLKEYWGVSLAALLYRARQLGNMNDVTYRNAMIRLSQNGWRRAEPGRVTSLEMPSMLPRAHEVLVEAGISKEQFLSGSGLPVRLYEIAVSRVPIMEET